MSHEGLTQAFINQDRPEWKQATVQVSSDAAHNISDSSQQYFLYLCLWVQTNRSQRCLPPPRNKYSTFVPSCYEICSCENAHTHTLASHSRTQTKSLTRKNNIWAHVIGSAKRRNPSPAPFVFLFKTQLNKNKRHPQFGFPFIIQFTSIWSVAK